jgi:transcriptional regulator with GAF, ATPase, and Fis domain
MEEWEKFAVTLADAARDLLAQTSHQRTLGKVVEHAATLVDGCDAASIMVRANGATRTVASTGELASRADQLQGKVRQGPCYDAIAERKQIYRLADTTDSARWPLFAEPAAGLGVGSVLGFVLHANDHDNMGALNLYSTNPLAFTERSERVGWIVASHCAVALATSRRDEAMQQALHNSRVIGTAVGVLMTRHRLTNESAFALLSRWSQDHNVKVAEIADTVARTGELPRG